MKKRLLIICSVILAFSYNLAAQCAMCTKTAAQLGEKPAEGMNSGILYLMATPFVIMGYLGYRWWKSQKSQADTNTPDQSASSER
jgi:hypothetical protein